TPTSGTGSRSDRLGCWGWTRDQIAGRMAERVYGSTQQDLTTGIQTFKQDIESITQNTRCSSVPGRDAQARTSNRSQEHQDLDHQGLASRSTHHAREIGRVN